MGSVTALLVTALLLAGNAFFVATEFALVSARRSQIEPRAQAGSRLARSTLRALGQMACMQHRPAHRIGAKAHRQPIDANRQRGAGLARLGPEPFLSWCERLGPHGPHAHEFDAEAGVDVVELGGEQARHMRRIARRRGKLERHGSWSQRRSVGTGEEGEQADRDVRAIRNTIKATANAAEAEGQQADHRRAAAKARV